MLSVPGFVCQEQPHKILVVKIQGKWILSRTVTSWRTEDFKKGFQRIVNEERCKEMAKQVLDSGRSFPNAVVLATEKAGPSNKSSNTFDFSDNSQFLVIDGQHRLWAQHYSKNDCPYICIIHFGLNKVEMAKLFLEINNNQKRVPASLRWDLVRLIQPEDDEFSVEASELVYELENRKESPFRGSIDLTGELRDKRVNQASLAPEIKNLVSSKKGAFSGLTFEEKFSALSRYYSAVRSLDPSGWDSVEADITRARVLRALARQINPLLGRAQSPAKADAVFFRSYLKKIDLYSLTTDRIKAKQGAAGIKDIAEMISSQIFKGKN